MISLTDLRVFGVLVQMEREAVTRKERREIRQAKKSLFHITNAVRHVEGLERERQADILHWFHGSWTDASVRDHDPDCQGCRLEAAEGALRGAESALLKARPSAHHALLLHIDHALSDITEALSGAKT